MKTVVKRKLVIRGRKSARALLFKHMDTGLIRVGHAVHYRLYVLGVLHSTGSILITRPRFLPRKLFVHRSPLSQTHFRKKKKTTCHIPRRKDTDQGICTALY